MILRPVRSDPAEQLSRLARAHLGCRASIRVGTAAHPGPVVAELPLISLHWQPAERRVRILLGDPAKDVWYPHSVWDVRKIDVQPTPVGTEVRMTYAGGTTTLSLFDRGTAPSRPSALARAGSRP